MHDRGGERGDAGDADVGPGARGGVGRHEQHRRKADVPEHQAHDPASERDGEAPRAEGDQLERVHEARKSPRNEVRIILSTITGCVCAPYSF